MSKLFSKIMIVFFAMALITTSMFSWSLFKRSAKITITGSTTVLPIAQSSAEYYMKNKNEKAVITVSGGGSSVGIAAILDNRADIGDASREAKEKEINAAKEKGIDLYKNVVALDGIAVVGHSNVAVGDLTKEQVKDIFAGIITNWKEVGGDDAEIIVISRDTSSGTYGSFVEMVLEKDKMRADAQMVASNQAMATTVAATPNSIGYLGLGFLKAANVKPIKVDGIEPNEKTVKDNSYPISRTLNMYTNGKPSGEIEDFINFIKSSKGQELVEDAGYIKL